MGITVPGHRAESESDSVKSNSLRSHGLFHGILQARILEWVARGSSQPRGQTRVYSLQANSLPNKPQGKPKNAGVGSLSLLQRIFLTQESNWDLLCFRQILYQLSYQGRPDSTLIILLCTLALNFFKINFY